jgi:hypothetical protein
LNFAGATLIKEIIMPHYPPPYLFDQLTDDEDKNVPAGGLVLINGDLLAEVGRTLNGELYIIDLPEDEIIHSVRLIDSGETGR